MAVRPRPSGGRGCGEQKSGISRPPTGWEHRRMLEGAHHPRRERSVGRSARAGRVSPDCPHHPSDVPCPLPRRIGRVRVWILPHSRSCPQMAGGRHSRGALSRPAQASLTLQPVGLLSRPRRPLSRGWSHSGCQPETAESASRSMDQFFSGWNLPPQVIRAFRAHCHLQTLAVGIEPTQHVPRNR